ncbi:twin-arginine translocation pathway signal protein [Gracilaria domingensis]|nr:twin-arginine translocation pathway signal protein [Gracilaria domingensis]
MLRQRSYQSNRSAPMAFAEARTEGDVQLLLFCANALRLPVCARAGGHSLVGKSMCQGIVIDVGFIDHVTPVGNAGDGLFDIGPGVTMGGVLWNLHSYGRWFASGVCPAVGMGGYTLGGGHGPYEGRLGLAIDQVVGVRMIDRFGRVVTANADTNPELFWGVRGAGGSQFGIVTSFRIKTESSAPFDKAVVFRFKWPRSVAGQFLHQWQQYDEDGGDVWFRVEMYLEKGGDGGVHGFGACYNVTAGLDECWARLSRTKFFNLPGRRTIFWSETTNALDVHAFFGPEGRWGRQRAVDVRKALQVPRYQGANAGNDRLYQSTFLKWTQPPPPAFWQTYADFCANPAGRDSVDFVVCEMNLFNNAIDKAQNNAFAHRDAEVITHYIIGGGNLDDQIFMYEWMRRHFSPYAKGVYVNYPELRLDNYARSYWGSSLPRLQQLKSEYDPFLFFLNAQPIPTAG